MSTITEEEIRVCLQQIETRLNRGAGLTWSNSEFEKLSSEIEDKTGVLLSVTTLKRLWGKVKYDHNPTLTTLNTLARFLDYENWRTFTSQIAKPQHEIVVTPVPALPKVQPARSSRIKHAVPFLVGGLLILFAMSFLVFSGRRNAKKTTVDSSLYSFKADKVISEGVPNSVIFTYDASAAKSDSVYIVQTWDINRKTLVSKNNKKHSAIYYYPGFFRTRLIVDSVVVKSHNLQISTDGWLCLVEKEDIPLYFKKEEVKKQKVIEVDEELLKKYNISLQPEPPRIRFFNQGDLGDLTNDNFTFETTLKNEFSSGSNICQFVQVLIQCKDDIIIIPLGAKTCAGNFNLYAAGKSLLSKEADLSGFGADLNQWTTLRVETKSKQMKFFVNGKQAAEFVFPNNPTGIVGVQFRFNGVGSVKDTWFEDANGKVMME